MCVEHALDVEEWAFSAFNDGTCKESLVLVKRRGLTGPPDNIKTKSLSLSFKKRTFHVIFFSFKPMILQKKVTFAKRRMAAMGRWLLLITNPMNLFLLITNPMNLFSRL